MQSLQSDTLFLHILGTAAIVLYYGIVVYVGVWSTQCEDDDDAAPQGQQFKSGYAHCDLRRLLCLSLMMLAAAGAVHSCREYKPIINPQLKKKKKRTTETQTEGTQRTSGLL